MPTRLEIGIDSTDPARLALFWAHALGYAVGDLDTAGVYLDLVSPDPSFPTVYLQRVPEAKTVKNRLHLDLYEVDPAAKIAALLALGANLIGTPRTGSEGGWWQVLADPEGNEFCVCAAD
jgi:predicted enzyme related to lactoylglutathione lyase